MEMGSILKTSGRFFQVLALVSMVKSVKRDFGYFFPFSSFGSCVSHNIGLKQILAFFSLTFIPW